MRTTRLSGACVLACAGLLLLSSPAQGQSFEIGASFTAATRGIDSNFIPPDTMGTVGQDHVVTLINGNYAVFDRSGSRLASVSLDAFWTNAGVPPDPNASPRFRFDPRVVYDPSSSRYFAVSVDNSGQANNLLVAVSNSSNPLDGWSGFAIDADANNSDWADFPTIGFNGDRLVLAANMFTISGQTGEGGVTLLNLPKADLLSGTPTVTAHTIFENVAGAATGFTVQPVQDLSGRTGTLPLLSAYNKPGGALKRSDIAGTAESPTLSTSGGFITVEARSGPPLMNQPGSKVNLQSGGSSLRSSIVYQEDSFWLVQGVEFDGRGAAEWYEIDATTNTVIQSGIISHETLDLAYPSLAVNGEGDVVIGFSGGSETQFVSAFAVVGTTDDLGQTTFGEVILLKAGVADYEALDGSGRNRWGDYSATVVDPMNPKAFWTFQEYVSAENVWSIQVTQILVPEPGCLLLIAGPLLLLRRRRA